MNSEALKLLESAEVARRLDRRAGFRIVAFSDVGLPVFAISPLVTLRERAQVGVVEEIVLKSLDAGVDTVEALSAFLGIPSTLVAT